MAEIETAGEGKLAMATSPAYRIHQEHCYPRLSPLRSSYRHCFYPTTVLFPDREQERGQAESRVPTVDENQEIEQEEQEEEEEEEEKELDIVSVSPTVDLPYDEYKASSIMLECARHLNLVKNPPSTDTSELLLDRAMSEGSYQQRVLLSQLLQILKADHLARLACSNTPHEPIKRRLNCDCAARQFRKTFSDINWDPKLTRWSHEILLQLLDADLLPIYLDILQVLKAKCPVLVEHMVHASMATVGGEAFGLLLKRPWNPVAGMHPLDKMVKFDPSPIFITLPYTSTGLGGRRWRLWQTQLGTIGKVYPIILPDTYSELRQTIPLSELAEQIVLSSLGRVQELRAQYPTRPVILLGWSLGARVACKVAEVESISLVVSLGLPCRGVHHKWEVSADPFQSCSVPTVFVVGSEGSTTSVEYVESLRSHMKCPTSLIVVGGGDDLLRLSSQDKELEQTCQSVVDRCILEKIYEFMVNELPCSVPDDTRPSRKRKSSHLDEVGPSFLTPAQPQSPILLHSPAVGEDSDGRNFNFNNSNPLFWKTFLGLRNGGRSSPASRSGTPSPIAFQDKRFSLEGLAAPAPKRLVVGSELTRVGRPRSHSAIDKSRKVTTVRSRSKSSDQSSPAPFLNLAGNTNTNNSNSVDVSPPQLLTLPPTSFRPLPITPPRNPFEDPESELLDPKTLRQLQRR